MKTLSIAILTLSLSMPAYALRCKGQIIDTGDTIQTIQSSCGDSIASEYRVKNLISDENKVYIKKDGMTYELKVIDGKLKSIEGSR